MIKYFTAHPTAANLLMIIFLLAGSISLPNILRETMPDFRPTEIEIRILYPGATAQQVEEVICQRVEDALDGISFIEEVSSDAREGIATIVVEMDTAGNNQTFINDIETEINTIDDFPSEVEQPIISELNRTDHVISLLISGPMSTTDLKKYCENFKDRLQQKGIPLVDISGFSDHQLRVSLSDSALRRTGLNASQIAANIAVQSRDIPLGTVETREQDILLRLTAQRRTSKELEDLIILAGPEGGELRLSDIGKVEDLFEHNEEKIIKDGQRYAILDIKKNKNQDAIKIATKVKNIIKKENKMHPQIKLQITKDDTEILKDRLNMLIENGIQGLILVFLSMWFFFNIRISFWVAMGLPVSFLGAFIFVPHLGMSINMFTMVGLLLALGLIMDDAIVIAENIMVHRHNGKTPIQAAIAGTKEVSAGIISSFITTICILGPLSMIEGQIGRVLKVIPTMLILVLAVSLIEAFFILPSHINHAMHKFNPEKSNSIRKYIDNLFEFFREKILGKTVKRLIKWRYLFFTSLIAIFILSLGMVASGKIKLQGFPDMEGDVIVARILMPQGTPLARMEKTVQQITDALKRTNHKFKPVQPDKKDLIQNVYIEYNKNIDAYENGPHVATITADLLTAEERKGTIDEYLTEWRKNTGELPDIINLNMGEPSIGPAGIPIEIRLRGDNLHTMKTAVNEMKKWFGKFNGVINITDDLRKGKTELRMKLKEDGYGIGINATEISTQLRAAFQGLEADEIQLGSEAYEIDVRLKNMDRDTISDIEDFNLIQSGNRQIPLKSVINWKESKGWARIARINGIRAVTLRADVDTRFINTTELINLFQSTFMKDFKNRYPQLKLSIEGSLRETTTTRKSMLFALITGMIAIFILLSFQFKTYTEPLIVMLAIPFSLIGVIWGHAIMGVPLSMPSILGFIALGGIVVNDSILLVLFMKNARKKGLPIHEAAAQASKDRLRAVLLTSSTTIAGLLPLLFEKSLQAQVLIPLVISTSFGLIASTVLVLLGLPCMYMILADFGIIEKINK